MLEVIKNMEAKNTFKDFTKIREEFENFLLKYKILPMQVVYRYGSGLKGYIALTTLLSYIIEQFENGNKTEQIINSLAGSKDFSYLQPKEVETSDQNQPHLILKQISNFFEGCTTITLKVPYLQRD